MLGWCVLLIISGLLVRGHKVGWKAWAEAAQSNKTRVATHLGMGQICERLWSTTPAPVTGKFDRDGGRGRVRFQSRQSLLLITCLEKRSILHGRALLPLAPPFRRCGATSAHAAAGPRMQSRNRRTRKRKTVARTATGPRQNLILQAYQG